MSKRFLIFLPIFILIGLSIIFVVITSLNVRYWADDFCFGGVLKMMGFWNTQISYWNSWTGRYASTFLISIFESIGPWVVRVLPIILFIFQSVSLYRLFLFNRMLAVLFVVLVLVNAPNISQSFYWQTGSLSYFAPFIFLNIYFGLLVFSKRKVNIFLPGTLLFIAGGFSESYVVMQTTLLFFVFFVFRVFFAKDENRMKIALSGMIGSLISLFLVYSAPGNAIRSTTITQPPDLYFVIKSTILGTKWYLIRMLGTESFDLSLIVIFSSIYLIGKEHSFSYRNALIIMIFSIIAGIFSASSVIGLGFYSMSILPPERTLFVVIYALLFNFLFFSFALISILKNNLFGKIRKIFFRAILVLNILAIVLLTRSMITRWMYVKDEIEKYAANFDKVEPKLLEMVGQEEVVINNINSVGELDSFSDNKGWVTGCLSSFYGVGNVKIAK